MKNLEKSWNFKMAIFRPGKVLAKQIKPESFNPSNCRVPSDFVLQR